LPWSTRKTAPEVKKEADNPIYELSAFCGGSGTWAHVHTATPSSHAALPGALSRKQIVLPAVHGADEGAPAKRHLVQQRQDDYAREAE
jgi:hypothetical protein